MHEAKRLAEVERYPGIRVVEERFDDVSGLSWTRIVFQESKVIKNIVAAVETKNKFAQGVRGESARRGAPAGTFKKSRAPRERKEPPKNTAFAVLRFGGIVLVMIAFILFLRYLTSTL